MNALHHSQIPNSLVLKNNRALSNKLLNKSILLCLFAISASSCFANTIEDIQSQADTAVGSTAIIISKQENSSNTTANDTADNENNSEKLNAEDATKISLSNNSSDNASDENSTSENSDTEFVDSFGDFDEEINDSDSEENNNSVYDPLRPYNEVMFDMNLALDNRLSKPITETYVKVTPPLARSGVSNFFNNIREPWSSINLFLQGRIPESLEVLGRFTVNSITTLGFGDPAASILNLRRYKEDFGQTLGVWGIPAGPYLVLPMFGPSTLRDATAKFTVDSQGSAIGKVDDLASKAALYGVYGLTKRASLMKYEGVISPNYEIVRDAYLQKRQFDIDEGTQKINKKHENTDNTTSETGFDESFGD